MKISVLSKIGIATLELGTLNGCTIVGSALDDTHDSPEGVGVLDRTIVTIATDEADTFVPEMGISKQELKIFLNSREVQFRLAEHFLVRAAITQCEFGEPDFKEMDGGFSVTVSIGFRPV